MSEEFRIRLAREEDVPGLVRFNHEMARETEGKDLDIEILSAGVSGILAEPSRGFYLVAEDDECVVGALMVTFEWSDWRNGTFWWLQSVYVLPAWRQRGVFSALYQTLREGALADPTGIGLRLYVERDNARAQRTYAALGMRETDYRLFEEEFPKP